MSTSYISEVKKKKNGSWSVLFKDFPSVSVNAPSYNDAVERSRTRLQLHIASLKAKKSPVPEPTDVCKYKMIDGDAIPLYVKVCR